MLIYLAEYLTRFHSGFNVFGYLTLRAILSALTALVLTFSPYMDLLAQALQLPNKK